MNKTFNTPDAAREAANQDSTCQNAGGFAIGELENGQWDYYPTGHPLPKGARLARKFYLTFGNERMVETDEEREAFNAFAAGVELTDAERAIINKAWWAK